MSPADAGPSRWRAAWAEVDLGALSGNVGVLVAVVAPAAVCAVVKADGYGHGAVASANAALAGGAKWLAVALVEEGAQLRAAGVEAPVLLLSEPPPQAMAEAAALGLTPTVYTLPGMAAAAAGAASAQRPLAVHLKVDTGMHRAGVAPEGALEVTRAVVEAPGLSLTGLWTHLAVAEDPAHDEFTAGQLDRFERTRAELAANGIEPPLVHAANSAGALRHPAARYDMVRCGITVYGYLPGQALAPRPGLGPVLSLRARVSLVRRLPEGERVSYGLRTPLPSDAMVATVPLGYADGVPRRLSEVGGEVLVGGRRCRLAGTVTMDQVLVDCGDAPVAVGDEAVLIGRQGTEEVTAIEWADRLGTISYEVLCGVGARVPRVYRPG